MKNEPDAFLWDAQSSPGYVTVYSRIGQHSDAEAGYYEERTAPADMEDPRVIALKREIVSIGYELVIVDNEPQDIDEHGRMRVTFRYPLDP